MSSKSDNNDEALSSADASPNSPNNSSSILRRSPDNKAAPDSTNTSNARPLVVTFSAVEDDARRDSNVVQNNDTTGPLPISALHRNISNQSTIDSALSGNSHLDADDPCVRRMFGLPSTKVATLEKRRRVEILLEQCEALRFPFKKRLLLANLDLSHDDVPVETICSDRLGTQLYKLSLAGNPLCKIPEPLVLKLTGLRVLDISQCGLNALPERWELPNLKTLNLSHNRLEQFPSERIICGLPELQALELYGNKISQLTLPKDASELSKLDYLDVGSNILTSIPDDLTKFHSLKTFKCMNNTLEIIPPAVCEMDLRVFDVSSNPLVQPPLETCERGLHSMRRYYHALKLEEMAGPESSQASPKNNILKTKHQRSRSKMRKRKDFVKRVFPSSLRPSCVFRSVSTESASGNSLYNSIDSQKSSMLSEQSPENNSKIQKPPLKSVSIHRSSLDVSEAKDSVSEKSLPSGQVIHEEEAIIDEKQLPKDNAESDSDDSRSDDGEIADVNKLVGLNNTTPKKVPGGITVNDTLKVMFVGNAMSGKTSIIKRLMEGKDATIPRKDERTIGVDIYNWDPKDSSTSLSTSIPQLSRSVHGDDIGVKFSIWDFAGQHVYHATHELFYSSQSLYIIVWDMGVSNPDTTQTRTSFNEEEKKMNAFKLTYDSSDDEDEDFFDSEQQTRRARRALEMDVDTKLQFWIDCIQMTTQGAAILPIASYDDYFDGNSEEAILRCQIMKERLRSHEERRVKSMQQRLKEYDSKLGVDSEQSLRLRRLLSSYNRPKIIFGDGPDSVVRVSSTHYTGFSTLASRIINIATGQERGGWKYPIFHGHVGVRIPRMRLEVRDVVRSMRDRFKVVEWNFFLAELEKKGIGADQAADVSDALLFLQNIGELSYFGEVATDEKNIHKYSQATIDEEGPISRHSSVESSVNSIDSLGLSDFIFLNPRWLVAAVACILRHDLSRELLETKRNLRNIEHLIEEDDSSYTFHDDDLPTTQSYPVITSHDTVLLWSAKRFTKKAAERALQYSISKVDPFEFLQRLLIKFGVFVPIDLCVEKAYLGGHDYSTSDLSGRPGNINNNTWLSPRYFFLPSLLGPGEPSDGWTYKTPDSWKAVVCHSILFPDGVPPGLMERITAYVLSDLYTNAPAVTSSKAFEVDLLPHDEEGSIRIKEILCWRSAFYLKLGKEVTDKSSGEIQENVTEIFATLVDERSPLCVSTGTMGAGMRRLIFSGKGQAGDFGSKIYTGGYMRVIKRAIKHVTHEYSGVEFERQAICPQCLAKKACSEASCWDHSYLRAAHASGDLIVRCSYGHVCDIRLLCGLADRSHDVQPDSQVVGEVDTPVTNLFDAVVIVGLWDEKCERIVRAGSGVIVDRKRGLIVTAGHTLMDKNTWREVDGKIVIGVCIDEPTAVFRYFARVLGTGVDNDGVCTIDACVLQITTRMETDSLDGGKDIGFTPETLLFNNPDAMKRENLPQLKLSQRFELDEVVRILGFNQGGEGLIGPGERLNRNADFARGYVVMRFTREESLPSFNRTFLPYEEIVVICPTRSGHSGGPCVNRSGEVIGILSRADPADPQRCYLVPTTEFKKLIKASKRRLKSTIMEGVPL